MGQLESIEIDGIGDFDSNSALNGDLTLHGIAKLIKNGDAKSIVVMCGAGISVACGIPDFRTPGTGLYYNLQKYHLPEPECMFDLAYFSEHPDAFYRYVLEMYPDQYLPSYTHYFIKLLYKKGLLLRCYTQNIDDLERTAEIPDSRLVQSHGSFHTASCIKCGKRYKTEVVRKNVLKNQIPHCKDKSCNGYIKPDIVFFGEPLPLRFNMLNKADMLAADLLIVLGTSLQVQPFCGLVNKVKENCPRLLVNKEAVGPFRFYTMDCCYRDVVYLGACDDGVKELCKELGWMDELEDLYTRGHAKLEKVRQKYLASKEIAQKQMDASVAAKNEGKSSTETQPKVISSSEQLLEQNPNQLSTSSIRKSMRLRNSSASSISSDMLLSTDDEEFSDYYSSHSYKGQDNELPVVGQVHTVNINNNSHP